MFLLKLPRPGPVTGRPLNKKPQVSDLGLLHNRQPNWSPRGDRIVFQRGSDAWVLFTVAVDGTALRRLTTEPGEHTDPSWSPDGRWVVFSSTSGGLELPQVFAISVDGGQPIRDPVVNS